MRHAMRAAMLLLMLVACRRETPAIASTPDAAPPPPAPAPSAPAASRASIDVTFAVASDTHFGFDGIEASNQRLIDRIHALPDKAWPASIGGSVGKLSGLVITGDLTEWGKPDEWDRFRVYYEDKVEKAGLPVFEMIGNHDKVTGSHVASAVAARHGGGRFYAWSWGGLRLVSLGEAPDDEGLAYLAKEVVSRPKDEPIMIFFHLALQGAWSTEHWFGQGDYKQRLAKTLAGKNVAAIVHGHQHVHGHETWSGFDVLKAGAAKHRDHSFFVVRAKDRKLDVAWLDFDRGEWIGSFTKSL